MIFAGTVVKGDQVGRKLGFPTANLDLEGPPPPNGVYAVEVEGRGRGVCNVGVRPTVGGKKLVIEVHLLDFSGDLYGQRLAAKVLKKLRDEMRFGSLDELKAQIARDVQAARLLQ